MIFVADACFSVHGKICDESGRGFGGGLALKPRACKEAIVFLFFLFIDIYLFIYFILFLSRVFSHKCSFLVSKR